MLSRVIKKNDVQRNRKSLYHERENHEVFLSVGSLWQGKTKRACVYPHGNAHKVFQAVPEQMSAQISSLRGGSMEVWVFVIVQTHVIQFSGRLHQVPKLSIILDYLYLQIFLTIIILTHPVNFSCGRKPKKLTTYRVVK